MTVTRIRIQLEPPRRVGDATVRAVVCEATKHGVLDARLWHAVAESLADPVSAHHLKS